jgi:hypothetical protein
MKGKTILLPAGTTLEGRMDRTISSSNSRQGQRFNIVLASPMLWGGSDVAIAAGSQIVGEVVEAIPAGKQKKVKGMPKPIGMLRVQITALITPDGASYPMVGSLAGERVVQNRRGKPNPNLGGGIGYVGSQANFDAVAPQGRAGGNGRTPQVVLRPDLAKNPLYGTDLGGAAGEPHIRSLVMRKQDLVIAGGSPVTVQLNAPLKLNLNSMAQTDSTYEAAAQHAYHTGERRFAQESEPPVEEGSSPAAPGGLPFLQPKQVGFPIPQQPAGDANGQPARQPSNNSSEF